MKITNNGDTPNSLQVSTMGNLSGDFQRDYPFLIKNISDADITLDVVLASCEDVITTVFYPGWNPELVVKVFNAPDGVLQYGY